MEHTDYSINLVPVAEHYSLCGASHVCRKTWQYTGNSSPEAQKKHDLSNFQIIVQSEFNPAFVAADADL